MRNMVNNEFSDFEIKPGLHGKVSVIWISFPYNREKIDKVKAFQAKWSRTNKCWYVPDNKHFRTLFGIEEQPVGKSVVTRMSEINGQALQRMKEVLQMKAYSPSTIKTYLTEFAQLLYILKAVPVDTLTHDKLRGYILYCINELKVSENRLHSRLNAFKFYFEQVLGRSDFFAEIPRPKKPSSLPKVFSRKEIERIFLVVTNPKHLLMLRLCYGMGLRVSEVANLKVSDINSGRMQVLIEAAKGKKDRYVPLPVSVLDPLRYYYREYKPKFYLFEGQYGGKYSIRSVQTVFKNAMKKAKVNKPVGIHGLRHSYATHLLEYGTDMTFIQKLLGHNDIKTTQIYARVSNARLAEIVSPLDRL